MTKEVLLALKGLQIENADGGQELETITAADYYLKNGSHYVLYEEVTEGYEDVTKNLIKFRDSCLEVRKKGLVNVHMVFEENKKNMTSYMTPYGNILCRWRRRKRRSGSTWIIFWRQTTSIWRIAR